MGYEFHWPKEGLVAYDIANGVMLLRLVHIDGKFFCSIQRGNVD